MKNRLEKPTRYFSDKQEKYVANILDGKKTLNSGATPFRKGDVYTSNLLIECKTSTTIKSQFTIKQEWLDKLRQESFAMGKDNCVLVFNFGPDTKNYYIINEDLFLDLIKDLK